jgi:uncharacterized membrane protein
MKRAVLQALDDPWTCAGLGLAAVQLILAAYVARYGAAGQIPLRFDLHGEAIGWGDRGVVVLVLLGLAVVTFAVTGFIGLRRMREPLPPAALLVLDIGCLSVLVGLAVATTALTSAGLGELEALMGRFDVARGVVALAWAIITSVGAFVGKTGPNALVGVRVPWTLNSRLAWDKANRMAGRILFLGGLAGIATLPLVSTRTTLALLLTLVAGAVLASLVEARRAWRSEAKAG